MPATIDETCVLGRVRGWRQHLLKMLIKATGLGEVIWEGRQGSGPGGMLVCGGGAREEAGEPGESGILKVNCC